AARLQQALESDSPKELADLLPEARAALLGLRALPGYEDYADWLEQRIDEIEVTQDLIAPPPIGPTPRPPAPKPVPPPPRIPPNVEKLRPPHYDLWLA